MNLVDITFAFSAGVASLFAPCSFPLLTAYIPYYLGLDAEATAGRAGDRDEGLRGETIGTVTWIWCGVGGGITASLGAVSVFVLLGALLGSVGRVIKPLVPGMEALVGGLLILLGLVMLLDLPLPALSGGPFLRRQGYAGLLGFGALYGAGVSACTLPIFLSVMLYALSQGGIVEGALTLLVYGLGVSIPLAGVTLLVAGAREAILRWLKAATPLVRQGGALVLIIVGFYLIYVYVTLFVLT